LKWVSLLLIAMALIALHLHVAVNTSNVLTYNADIYLRKLLGLEITSASLKIGHVEVSLVAPGGYVYATTTIWYPIVSFCVRNNGSYPVVIEVTRVHLYKGEALIAYNEVQRRPSMTPSPHPKRPGSKPGLSERFVGSPLGSALLIPPIGFPILGASPFQGRGASAPAGSPGAPSPRWLLSPHSPVESKP
jgi:hypothetical protein